MTDHDVHSYDHPQAAADQRLAPPPTPVSAAPMATAAMPVVPQTDADERRVTVRTETMGPRLDRIRWASVWAGLAVALAIYLFLQLALITSGTVDLADATSSDAYWSAGAALVAFLIGGVVAGATAVWRDADDGLLHGIVMWAVGVVAIVVLAAVSGGIALGTVDTSDVFDQITGDEAAESSTNEEAEEAAGWALIGLTSALVASALGATIGSKMWPRRRSTDRSEFSSGTRDGYDAP